MPTTRIIPPLAMRAPGNAGGAREGVAKNAFGQNFRFVSELEMHAAWLMRHGTVMAVPTATRDFTSNCKRVLHLGVYQHEFIGSCFFLKAYFHCLYFEVVLL